MHLLYSVIYVPFVKLHTCSYALLGTALATGGFAAQEGRGGGRGESRSILQHECNHVAVQCADRMDLVLAKQLMLLCLRGAFSRFWRSVSSLKAKRKAYKAFYKFRCVNLERFELSSHIVVYSINVSISYY